MKYNKLLFGYIICITLALTSCNNLNPIEPETTETIHVTEINIEEVIKTPVSGGTLNIGIRNPTTLNPLLNEDKSIDEVLKLIYDELITLDKNLKPTSNIASSWEFSSDGMTLTIKLRNDIYWHNANHLTARDIIFSLDTIKKAPKTSAYKACINNISSYKYIDDYTISIGYNQPFSGALYALNFPIISSEYYGSEDILTSNKNMSPIGTGAYEFDGFTVMKELNLKKNPKWFKGVPYIDNIKAIVIPKKEAELYAFDQNQIDILNTDVADWEKYNNTRIYEYPTNYYDFVGVNFKNPILSDKLIRQALAYCVPKDKIITEIYLTHALPTDVPINPNSWLNNNTELVYNYNIIKAKELLKQAGWEDLDNNGIVEKDGVELIFSLLVNEENQERLEVANILKECFKEVGIEVSIDVQTYDVYVEKLQQKDFDSFLGGWKLSTIPDFTFAFHSSQIKDGTNYISYSNPTMDNLLQQAFIATNDTTMKEAYKHISDFITDELPYISLYFRNSAILINDKIKGDINSDMSNIYLGIENCYINEE